jgi:hypothetical protein
VQQPRIGGVKLDIAFMTMRQLERQTDDQIRRALRPAMIAGSLILFDKTGRLDVLREGCRNLTPSPLSESDLHWIRLAIRQVDAKVSDNMTRDPSTSLLAMHADLNELINSHYRLRQRWTVSSKKILGDLRQWDPAFADLIVEFVSTGDLNQKYAYWSAIVDYVSATVGGRAELSKSCDCDACRRDLAALLGGSG